MTQPIRGQLVQRRPPHLPFLAGPATFTVGLKPIPLSAWVTPDYEAAALTEKRALLANSRDAVYRRLDGSVAAEAEAASLIAAAVNAAPSVTLADAATLISDDLAIMIPTGEVGRSAWVAGAVCLCSPTYFSAEEAIGKSLWGLHGPVPDTLANGAQGLGDRIGRVFSALQPDTVLERFNWTVQAGPARYTPSSAPVMALAAATPLADARDVLHLRVERQTIRKLPNSSAVLFTIRISLDPLRSVFATPGAQDAFAKAWAATEGHVRGYKRWPALDRLVAAALVG